MASNLPESVGQIFWNRFFFKRFAEVYCLSKGFQTGGAALTIVQVFLNFITHVRIEFPVNKF